MNKEFTTILKNLEEIMDQLDTFNYKNFGFDSDSEASKQIEKSFLAIREELEELQELDV